MSNLQTDNSYLSQKVNLRIKYLPNKKNINVLNCFAGHNLIWENIIRLVKNKEFSVTNIDIKHNFDKAMLKGDNIKYMAKMNLNKYDIIDLDAYGIPFKQLQLLFDKKYKGHVYITYISSVFGCLPKKMLNKLGYTNEMIDKIPTLFNKNPFDKLCNYLYINNVRDIYYLKLKNKYYIYIKIK